MRRLTKALCLNCWRVRFMGFAAVLIVSSAAWLGLPHGTTSTIPELLLAGKLTAQLYDVPSHNRLYRASLLPLTDPANRDGIEWKLRVEKSDREPVSGASLVMQAWMPEEPAVAEYRPRVSADGDGGYHIEGLRLDRAGWWNMRLRITHAGMTDSLAFNIIMP